MKEANRYSILGVAFAFLTIGIFGGNSFFSIAMAGFNLANLPRELRLGIDTGLITQSQCSSRHLNSACNKGEFGQKLGLLLQQIGAAEDTSLKGIAKLGIFEAHPATRSLKRKEAMEALSRTCIFLAAKGLIKLPEEKAVNYRDYTIPAKYSAAMNYLQKKFVVRGYPDGTLGANKKMSNREAVYFLYRIYEAVATDMMVSGSGQGIRFVDISLSHPIMDSIKTLTQAGAFDKVLLKPAFDGESNISTLELSEMLEGIFGRAKVTIDQIRIRTIFSGEPGKNSANRRQLAMTLEYLLSATNALTTTPEATVNFTDVTKDSEEFVALSKLAANEIWLGYQGRKFNGSENVSWFETVSAVAKVANLLPVIQKKNPSNERLAQKADIENFMELIKAKKAKIRLILDRKRVYTR